MQRTPTGTTVGVDDPYAHVERCDHLTDDGRCRFALRHPGEDRAFADERKAAEFACLVGEDGSWADCRHFRSTPAADCCRRCGLPERRVAHDPTSQPLLEEHHLSYADGIGDHRHEITVRLCRWCHAKVHGSWARLTDDVAPDPEAIAELESRRGAELAEASFRTAAERRAE